jgi:hypothetical protein
VKRTGKKIPTASTGNEAQTLTEKIKMPFSTKNRHYAQKTGKKRQKHHEIRVKLCEVRVKFPEMNVNET